MNEGTMLSAVIVGDGIEVFADENEESLAE